MFMIVININALDSKLRISVIVYMEGSPFKVALGDLVKLVA